MIRISPVRADNDSALDFIEHIYTESFPPDERRDFDEVVRLLRENDDFAIVADRGLLEREGRGGRVDRPGTVQGRAEIGVTGVASSNLIRNALLDAESVIGIRERPCREIQFFQRRILFIPLEVARNNLIEIREVVHADRLLRFDPGVPEDRERVGVDLKCQQCAAGSDGEKKLFHGRSPFSFARRVMRLLKQYHNKWIFATPDLYFPQNVVHCFHSSLLQ